MVEPTPLKNNNQIGNLPQGRGENNKKIGTGPPPRKPDQRNSALMRRQEANHAGYSNSPFILKTNAFTGHVHEEQGKPSATAFYSSKLSLTVRAKCFLKPKPVCGYLFAPGTQMTFF